MPHDEHFLQRLDRLSGSHEQLELALGLYRDHELVRYVLDNLRLPEGAERVAIALAQGEDSPHVVVTREGRFVTCLGAGMKPGPHPVVSRAHLDALATKVERVREGLALARKRGMDDAKLLEKMNHAGPAFSREDFTAAKSVIGPATSLLLGEFHAWSEALHDIYPVLARSTVAKPARRTGAIAIARGTWAMAHAAMLQIDTASREWVERVAGIESWNRSSPWTWLYHFSAFPFLARAAWIAARLGKPMLPSYRGRFAKPTDLLDLSEAGWGLGAMALRHKGLRGECLRALSGRKPGPDDPKGAASLAETIAGAIEQIAAHEEEFRESALKTGRDAAVALTADLPESSPHRIDAPERVPDDLVLPALFDLAWDSMHEDRGVQLFMLALPSIARADAEDFYYPAQFLHALGPWEPEPYGEMLVDMYKARSGERKPVVRQPTPGRNDPCSCGSGKKYKKCHGR